MNKLQTELLSALQEKTDILIRDLSWVIYAAHKQEIRDLCEQWRQFGYQECLNKHNINEKGKTISKKTANKILPEANPHSKTRKRN